VKVNVGEIDAGYPQLLGVHHDVTRICRHC
jgi:hypothetical protein